MALRSILLLAFMVIVPALAMFSHLIPAEARAACRRNMSAATSGWFGTAAEAGMPAARPTETAAAAVAPPTPLTRPPVVEAPASTTAAPPTPLVSQLVDRTLQARDQQARDQRAIELQLENMGAVLFDCQPLPGVDGMHSSSCRVPVDATGQLQRVFQATGHDPGSAAAALLEQVAAWRQRTAFQPPAGSPTTATSPPQSDKPRPDSRFQ